MKHLDCAICAQQPPDDETVFGAGSWSLSIPSGQAPWLGWVTVHPVSHRSSPDELDERETRELGPLLTAASRFLRELTAAERIYIANWAEATRHVHFHLIPRAPGLDGELQAAKVFTLMGGPREAWPSFAEQLATLRALAGHLRERGLA